MSTAATLSEAIELVDIAKFLAGEKDDDNCEKLARSLRQFGAVLIRDPRVKEEDSAQFLDMMERYFSQPTVTKLKDARPELFYQVGVTPNGVERPRDNSDIAKELEESEKPVSNLSAREKDPKWRFFWRCGERPMDTAYPELNAPQVIPEAFEEEWADTMNGWGGKLVEAVLIASEMLSLGLGLPRKAIREKLELGPHLLAPTGSDLGLLADKVGTTIAGYHYDLNILTIHGRARFPGLFVWTRTGKRIPVVVPEGYLLIQSGIQLEYLTGGEIKRGMHEVVISPETSEAAKRAKEEGGSLWRVSSTLFAHVRSDAFLGPLGHFATASNADNYPSIQAGEQVAQELRALELAT